MQCVHHRESPRTVGSSATEPPRPLRGVQLIPVPRLGLCNNVDALLNALMEEGLAAWEGIARDIRVRDPMQWIERLMEGFLEFALTQPHLFEAAFFLPAPRARQYPDDFVAGHSPVVAMMFVRIDQAKADGRLGGKPALDVALALAAVGQGLVSMHRANRFCSGQQLKTLYRTTVRHCLESFAAGAVGSAR